MDRVIMGGNNRINGMKRLLRDWVSGARDSLKLDVVACHHGKVVSIHGDSLHPLIHIISL